MPVDVIALCLGSFVYGILEGYGDAAIGCAIRAVTAGMMEDDALSVSAVTLGPELGSEVGEIHGGIPSSLDG